MEERSLNNIIPSLYRRASIWHFLFSVMIIFVIWEAYIEFPLSTAFSTPSVMQAMSPDEIGFIEHSEHSLTFLQFSLGYGPAFWLIPIAAVKFFGSETAVLISRIIFVSMKYAGIFCVALPLVAKRKTPAACVFLALTATTPGFFFFGKIISPEYELIFFAALTMSMLFLDDGRNSRFFIAALVFASAALATKITAAPLLFFTAIYGLACFFLRPQRSLHERRLLIRSLAGCAASWIVLILLCGPVEVVRQINDAMSIVSQSEYNFSTLKMAFTRTGITWDQIMIGGLVPDFIPVIISTLCLALGGIVIRKVTAPFITAVTGTLAAIIVLYQCAIHAGAVGWYLFLPATLFIICASYTLTLLSQKISIAFFLLTVLSFSYHDRHRIQDRINFKRENVNMIAKSVDVAGSVIKDIQNRYPCAKSVSLDFLIASNDVDGYIPMRTALNLRSTKKYFSPDVVLLNSFLISHREGSPLLNYVFNGDLSAYQEIQKDSDFVLLIKKGIYENACSANATT